MAAAPQQQQQPLASATEQRAPLFTSGVLPVMLQHPDISSSERTVCRLLCSSKALRSAVLQHASGMVHLGYDERSSLQRLCCWLSGHGHLLKVLAVDGHLSLADSAHLACALQEAAASTPGGLRLQAFAAELPSAMAGLVLQQLLSQHLMFLELTVHIPPQQPDPCVQLTARALAGLTNLSVLSLQCELEEESDSTLAPVDAIMPALSSLSRLTNLNLSSCSKGRLSLLPQQLVELELYEQVAAQPSEQLQLGHLTALTRLVCSSACVQAGDVLPPNLLSLDIRDCSAAGPLAALTRLTRLGLERLSGSMSVAGLVSGIAGRLQQLQKLRVCYDYEAAAAAAAGPAVVWPTATAAAVLPTLHELSIWTLPGSMLLGAADAISRLCALTGLTLRVFGGEQDGAALDALARAVAVLPRLQNLFTYRVQFGRSAAAAQLLSGAATSLTSLTIYGADLTDHFVSRMFASGLTGLRSLNFFHNPAVSVPCLLLLVVGCLPRLTALDYLFTPGDGSEADAQCRRRIESVLQQRHQGCAVMTEGGG